MSVEPLSPPSSERADGGGRGQTMGLVAPTCTIGAQMIDVGVKFKWRDAKLLYQQLYIRETAGGKDA